MGTPEVVSVATVLRFVKRCLSKVFGGIATMGSPKLIEVFPINLERVWDHNPKQLKAMQSKLKRQVNQLYREEDNLRARIVRLKDRHDSLITKLTIVEGVLADKAPKKPADP
jgi:hypothetical protein